MLVCAWIKRRQGKIKEKGQGKGIWAKINTYLITHVYFILRFVYDYRAVRVRTSCVLASKKHTSELNLNHISSIVSESDRLSHSTMPQT